LLQLLGNGGDVNKLTFDDSDSVEDNDDHAD
jgi:hypothetical protein